MELNQGHPNGNDQANVDTVSAVNGVLELLMQDGDEQAQGNAATAAAKLLLNCGPEIVAALQDKSRLDLFEEVLLRRKHAALAYPQQICDAVEERDGEGRVTIRSLIDCFEEWYEQHGVGPELFPDDQPIFGEAPVQEEA